MENLNKKDLENVQGGITEYGYVDSLDSILDPQEGDTCLVKGSKMQLVVPGVKSITAHEYTFLEGK